MKVTGLNLVEVRDTTFRLKVVILFEFRLAADLDKDLGVRVDFDDGWRPGVAVSLYEWGSPTLDKGFLLHTEEDCPKVFQWMLHRPR